MRRRYPVEPMIWLRRIIFGTFAAMVLVFYLRDDGRTPRRPDPRNFDLTERTLPPPADPAEESGRETLSEPSLLDPEFRVQGEQPCPEICVGSAFAIDDAGHWLTASHVLAGCARLTLNTGRALTVRKVFNHPRADVSLMVAKPAADPLPLNLGQLYQRQDGFHIGFPAGKPGDVHGLLIGHASARHGGPGGWKEPVIAWAEVSRNPSRKGSLGGLSGGAVLDRSGAVVGVTVSESPRRGRVISAAPISLQQVIKGAGITVPGNTSSGNRNITAGNYGQAGKTLRRQHSVAQVICHAES